MPKKPRVRETENPLGRKINQVMAEKGIEGDYAELARVFAVATPSTYDWVTHGRLGKERYQRLVEWSGRSLDWWFDITTASESQGDITADVVPLIQRERWPLEVDFATLNAMSSEEHRLINAYIRGLIDGGRAGNGKSKKA